MRSKNRAFLMALALALGSLVVPDRRADASVSVSFFYDSLAPYGEWVTVSGYGRCWRPARVAADWQPYLDGEWEYTDYGWTWVSFDPWGGDPYHYGTWVYTAHFGWVWIPGTVWAPAWVTWCVTDDFFGWAPVGPSFAVGTSGYFGPALRVSRRAYVFVPARSFVGANVRTARVPISRNATLVARSRPMTRFAVQGGVLAGGGPPLTRVEQVAGHRIQRVPLARAKTQAVPLATSLRSGRASVVVPASERARLSAPRAEHASPAARRAPEVARERAVRPPSPEREAQPQASRRAPEVARPERAVRPPSPEREAQPQASRRAPEDARPERAAAPPQAPRREAAPPPREQAPRRESAPPPRVERPPKAPPAAAAPPPARGNPPPKAKEESRPPKDKEHGGSG